MKQWAGLHHAHISNPEEQHGWFSISSSGHKGGTAILLSSRFRAKCTVSDIQFDTEYDGAWTSILMATAGMVFRMESVYFPQDNIARVACMNDYFPGLETRGDTHHVLTSGDWNCVESVRRDTNNPSYANVGGGNLGEWIAVTGLRDAWGKKKGGFTRYDWGGTATRLDRLYVSSHTSQLVSKISVKPTPSMLDHRALTVRLKLKKPSGGSSHWRFNHQLLKEESVDLLVHSFFEWWKTQKTEEMPLLTWWCDFKCMLKTVLIDHSKVLAKQRRQRMWEVESQLMEEGLEFQARSALAAQLGEMVHAQSELFYLQAGADRQESGDRPTAAFFAQAKARSASRGITSLTDPSTATITSDEGEIKQLITSFWGDVFGDPSYVQPEEHPPTEQSMEASIGRLQRSLSNEERIALSASFTVDELSASLKKGWLHSSPGPDGLPRSFYKHYWELFSPTLLQLALDAQDGALFSQDFNNGIVALLPKTDLESPESGHFRPITLLNVDYKLIAGMVAGRIKINLEQLIHETQTGFVPNRLILYNLTFVRDVIQWSKVTDSPVYIAFLDFEKAFDRVNWVYRDLVMRKVGYPPSLIGMITSLYHHASVQINVNGQLTERITQGRGVRQGCPMSPFIFALFVEPLGQLLREKQAEFGLMLPRTLACNEDDDQYILGTQFADDTTLFSGEVDKLEAAFGCVEVDFCRPSGARLNVIKTEVLCARGDSDTIIGRVGDMCLKGAAWTKSLGGVYGDEVAPQARFDKVIDKMLDRMLRLQKKGVSLMGRVLFSNSLLSSCLWFFMS